MLKVVKRNPRSPNLSDSPVILFIPCQKKVQPIRNLETRSISLKRSRRCLRSPHFPAKIGADSGWHFLFSQIFQKQLCNNTTKPKFLNNITIRISQKSVKKEYETKSNRLQRAKNFSAETNKTKQCCENSCTQNQKHSPANLTFSSDAGKIDRGEFELYSLTSC